MDDIKARMLQQTKKIADQAKAEKEAAVALIRMRHGPAAGEVLEAMMASVGFLKIIKIHLDDVPRGLARELDSHFGMVLSAQLDFVRRAGNVSDTAMAEIESYAKNLTESLEKHEKELADTLRSGLGELGSFFGGSSGEGGGKG